MGSKKCIFFPSWILLVNVVGAQFMEVNERQLSNITSFLNGSSTWKKKKKKGRGRKEAFGISSEGR